MAPRRPLCPIWLVAVDSWTVDETSGEINNLGILDPNYQELSRPADSEKFAPAYG
jgi:hypothetical protein